MGNVKAEASVWRLGPGGYMLTSVSEKTALELAETQKDCVYFYADLEESANLRCDASTMQKVFATLGDEGLSEKQAVSAMNALNSAGILFRELNF